MLFAGHVPKRAITQSLETTVPATTPLESDHLLTDSTTPTATAQETIIYGTLISDSVIFSSFVPPNIPAGLLRVPVLNRLDLVCAEM